MTPERPTGEVRRRRLWPHPVLGGVVGVVMLLLFCWPFVQAQRPTLPAAFYHVFASWSAAIVLLVWISRGFGRAPDSDDGDGDG